MGYINCRLNGTNSSTLLKGGTNGERTSSIRGSLKFTTSFFFLNSIQSILKKKMGYSLLINCCYYYYYYYFTFSRIFPNKLFLSFVMVSSVVTISFPPQIILIQSFLLFSPVFNEFTPFITISAPFLEEEVRWKIDERKVRRKCILKKKKKRKKTKKV